MMSGVKAVVVGDTGVGKTALCVRLEDASDTATEQVGFPSGHRPTVSASVASIRRGDRKINLWDTAGQEKYSSLVPLYVRGAGLAVVVGDERHSKEYYEQWERKIRDTNEKCRILRVKNKRDLNEEEIEGAVLVSALSGVGVTNLVERMLSSCEDEPQVPDAIQRGEHGDEKDACC